MKALLPIIRLLLTAEPKSMIRGAALSVIVLLMGAALLGLSGWFITATGIAGLAGVGIAFDVFRPSAGVRFLALGRTAARYGERLLTHDATLRALAALRVTLLRRQVGLDARALARLRGEAELTRIISDVDALDGVILRFVLPGLAALLTHLVVFLALAWLAGWAVAAAVLLGYVPVAVLVFWRLARQSIVPSDQVETQSQALRRGMIDMIRDRQALILRARIADREADLLAIDASTRKMMRALDLSDRNAIAALSVLTAAVTGLALLVGAAFVGQGALDPATGAIGVFVALALAEALPPFARGVADFGRMAGAAKRIGKAPGPIPATAVRPDSKPDEPVLSVDTPDLTLQLEAGKAAVLTGPSGGGKTSLLMQIAGMAASEGVFILGTGVAEWPDAELRNIVTMVPQRSALIAGTIRENLSLSGETEDEEMWRALAAVALDDVVRARDGLETQLGEGGTGLSGGQARRLTLARALLRKPKLLLLDEPIEGLDDATASRVLTGIRGMLPEAAILATLHRSADHPVFNISQKLDIRR